MQIRIIPLAFTLILSIIISLSLFQSLLPNFQYVYSQLQIGDSFLNTKFVEYYNPLSMIKIHYPSFWQKYEVSNTGITSFVSPVNSVGVMVQSVPTQNVSVYEIALNTIGYIKKNFSNATILNTAISNSSDGSIIQTLAFTYGNDLEKHKISMSSKIFDDKSYVFLYYADDILYDRFFPLSSTMLDSFQIPYFNKVFSLENLVNSGGIIRSGVFESIDMGNTTTDSTVSILTNDTKNNQTTRAQDLRTIELGNTTTDSTVSILTNDTQNNQTSENDDFVTYDNKTLGINIQYPSSFNKIENDQGILFTQNNGSIGVMGINIPLSNASLSEFNVSQISSLNQTLAEFNILNYSVSDILDYPTQMLLFDYDNGTQPYKGMQFWKLGEDNVFIFTYFAPTLQDFNDFLPTVSRMVESLKLS